MPEQNVFNDLKIILNDEEKDLEKKQSDFKQSLSFLIPYDLVYNDENRSNLPFANPYEISEKLNTNKLNVPNKLKEELTSLLKKFFEIFNDQRLETVDAIIACYRFALDIPNDQGKKPSEEDEQSLLNSMNNKLEKLIDKKNLERKIIAFKPYYQDFVTLWRECEKYHRRVKVQRMPLDVLEGNYVSIKTSMLLLIAEVKYLREGGSNSDDTVVFQNIESLEKLLKTQRPSLNHMQFVVTNATELEFVKQKLTCLKEKLECNKNIVVANNQKELANSSDVSPSFLDKTFSATSQVGVYGNIQENNEHIQKPQTDTGFLSLYEQIASSINRFLQKFYLNTSIQSLNAGLFGINPDTPKCGLTREEAHTAIKGISNGISFSIPIMSH